MQQLGTVLGNIVSLGVILTILISYRNKTERLRLEEIQQANRELRELSETLEGRVQKRTEQLETARREADEARQLAEEQSWLTTGQAELSEQMRGELEVEALANQVVSYLCRYLGAQAGTLFIVKEKNLRLAGSFAYSPHPGAKEVLAFGEGLVGQVAQNKKMLLLDEIPADSLRIRSSLGDGAPRQIAILPLKANSKVVGVVELATLHEFSAKHQVFMGRVAESIAIALQTAQTQENMSRLLVESQRQAEELQAQEEELRSINEELQAQTENLKTTQGKE